MEQFAQVLTDNGGDMEFSAFVAASRAAGVRAENWLKAKHAGIIETYLTETGELRARVPAVVPEGE